jgi:hypothetical protein
VLIDFVELTSRIQERLPKTQIVFVSIKPSPARVDLLDRIRETNTRIRNYVATKPYLKYIDVFTPMLDAKGKPRGELFGSDSLHLNEEGYALWHALIAPVLPLEEQPAIMRDAVNPPPKPSAIATAASKAGPEAAVKPRQDAVEAKPAPGVPASAAAEPLARTPAAPATVKVDLQPAPPVPSPTPEAVPPEQLAKAPPSPPPVKTNVQPAAPSPAPPPLNEPPEPPAALPTTPQEGAAAERQAMDVPPPAVPAAESTAGDRTAGTTSGGSNAGGTGGASTLGTSDGVGQGRRD